MKQTAESTGVTLKKATETVTSQDVTAVMDWAMDLAVFSTTHKPIVPFVAQPVRSAVVRPVYSAVWGPVYEAVSAALGP